MRDLLLTLFVFGMLPVCFRKPYYGLLIWSWLGYMNPHRLTWSYAWSMPFVYYTALATLLGLLFYPEERSKFSMKGPVKWWAFLCFWMTVTSFFSLQPDWGYGMGAWYEWERTMKIMVMAWVTMLVVNTRKKLFMLAGVIAFSFGFYGIKGGFFTVRTGGFYYVLGPDMSFMTDNNTVALALLVSFPMLYFIYLHSERWFVRWPLLVGMLLHLVAILGTQSRGGFLGLAIFLMILLLKARRKFILMLISGFVITAMIIYMPETWRSKMRSIENYQKEGSAQQRMEAWEFAIKLVLARPLVGGGFESFQPKNYRIYMPEAVAMRDAHSIYFEMLAEHGVVGFFFWLLMHLSSYRTGSRIIRRCRNWEEMRWARDLAIQIQLGHVAFASAGVFVGMAYYDLPVQYVAMMSTLWRVIEVEQVPEEKKKTPVRSIFGPAPVKGVRPAPGSANGVARRA